VVDRHHGCVKNGRGVVCSEACHGAGRATIFGSLSDKCLDRMLGTDCMSLRFPGFQVLGLCLMRAPFLARILIHAVVDMRTMTIAHIGPCYWNRLDHSCYS
jgi:hypothetical protein